MADDVHLTMRGVIWCGILDAFGRFHEAELTEIQQKDLKIGRTNYWFGQILGSGIRAVVGAIVIYATTANLQGAVISILVLVVGDQALTTSTGKT